jgi:hypothetical protein
MKVHCDNCHSPAHTIDYCPYLKSRPARIDSDEALDHDLQDLGLVGEKLAKAVRQRIIKLIHEREAMAALHQQAYMDRKRLAAIEEKK